MPSPPTIADNDRDKIKAVVHTKIYSAALARIYYTYPQPNKWSYTGLQGALVFTLDKSDGTFHFKIVDLEGTRGILWEHELYKDLEYNNESNFFHSFEGDVCLIPVSKHQPN
jgi:Wiskott-Aldrich syndrome protein